MGRLQDIIKNKKTGIDEDLLNEVIDQLREKGIRILPLDMDEGYKADMSEAGKFIPSDANIVQVPITVSTIMDRLENKEYDLTPAYVNVDSCILTVNTYSYTIITTHREKK